MPSTDSLNVQEPPRRLGGVLRHIGPGFILAGALVGSGELIATTATGAESGFTLLWLIILGCVIKVFVQVEIGRHTITHSESSLQALNGVPGPRLRIPGLSSHGPILINWIMVCWLLMFTATMFLFGGIIGGIGQSLAMTFPLTEQGRAYNDYQNISVGLSIRETELAASSNPETNEKLSREIGEYQRQLANLEEPTRPYDDRYWASIVTLLTILILYFGRYRFIETFSIVLVGSFTLITIYNLIELQRHPGWSISPGELFSGLRFGLPEAGVGRNPMITALATFGIIGVGASDLVAYPYWCLEKGYARWTGVNDGSEAWVGRAKGWLKVLQWDAWSACILYTFTTVAFYLLGAAVLGRIGLVPEGSEMVRTLSAIYEPVFGAAAQLLFLFGAIAVLYSTFFIGNAGHCRLATDAVRVMNFVGDHEDTRRRWMKASAIVLPLLCVTTYYTVGSPVFLVLVGGIAQALLLPMVAFAALFFRHRRCHPDLKPSPAWDLFLGVSFVAFTVIGLYLVYVNLS
jgi:Mn2+/Fe2+ NRAMP family transporter